MTPSPDPLATPTQTGDRISGDRISDHRANRAQRRIEAFVASFAPDAQQPNQHPNQHLNQHQQLMLALACHAAFPLMLTTELVYCLRENFVPDCPWYGAPDLLLSGLCEPVGHDLYEMAADTRQALLCRLVAGLATPAEQTAYLERLADFMADFIRQRLATERGNGALNLGEPGAMQWTVLALLRPGDLYDQICHDLRRLLRSADARDRLRLSLLIESYDAWLPPELRDRFRLIDLADRVTGGEPDPTDPPGFELTEFEAEVVTLEVVRQEPESLEPDWVQSIQLDDQGAIVQQLQHQIYRYEEPLELPSDPSNPTSDLVSLEMVAIPSGSFVMGSPVDERGRYADEGPCREVQVAAFFMGRYPVTQAQWRAVAALPLVQRELPLDPSGFKGRNRPVEQVSWEEAREFCDRLSRYTGRVYRLPTEAEWEYACRAGTTTPFSFGPTITPEVANYNGLYAYGTMPPGRDRQETLPVGQFPPNPFGLGDMHGNVWEWCLDVAHDSYAGAPEQAINWSPPTDSWLALAEDLPLRIRRGGSWRTASENCRAAARDSSYQDYRFYSYGFRVVCEAIVTCPAYNIDDPALINDEPEFDPNELDLEFEDLEDRDPEQSTQKDSLDQELHKLVLAAQNAPKMSSRRNSYLGKLVARVKSKSGLVRPTTTTISRSHPAYSECYQEACSDLWEWVFKNIDRYNPDRGSVLGWLNFYLSRRFFPEACKRDVVFNFLRKNSLENTVDKYERKIKVDLDENQFAIILQVSFEENDHVDFRVFLRIWKQNDTSIELPNQLIMGILDSYKRVVMQAETGQHEVLLTFEFSAEKNETFYIYLKYRNNEVIKEFVA